MEFGNNFEDNCPLCNSPWRYYDCTNIDCDMQVVASRRGAPTSFARRIGQRLIVWKNGISIIYMEPTMASVPIKTNFPIPYSITKDELEKLLILL